MNHERLAREMLAKRFQNQSTVVGKLIFRVLFLCPAVLKCFWGNTLQEALVLRGTLKYLVPFFISPDRTNRQPVLFRHSEYLALLLTY